MTHKVVERFIHALQEAEQTRDSAPLTALFSDDAELRNLSATVRSGREGAQQFWDDYLAAFSQIRSQFTEIMEGRDGAALEWTAQGVLPTGRVVTYRGVSILELDGDRVRQFRAYYDSAAFFPQGAPSGD